MRSPRDGGNDPGDAHPNRSLQHEWPVPDDVVRERPRGNPASQVEPGLGVVETVPGPSAQNFAMLSCRAVRVSAIVRPIASPAARAVEEPDGATRVADSW
jgi:hypothetical protein